MVDGDFENVRVAAPSPGGVLYFLNQGNDTGNGCAIYKSTGDALRFRGGPVGFVFNTVDNTTRVTITNGGQTTMRSSDSTPLVLTAGSSATPYGVNIRFRRSDAAEIWALGAGVGGGSQQDFGLVDVLANNAVRLLVDASGRVGVGTTAPGSLTKLDTVGTIRARDGAGTDQGVELLHSNGVGNVFAYIRASPGSGYLPLRLDGTSLFLNTMPGTGNVGIGTATIEARLHVAGTTKLDGNVGISVANRPERLAVLGIDTQQAVNIGAFFASDYSEGVGIGKQDVRQILPGHPLNLNAGTTGPVKIGNASSGHITLGEGGGSVGVGTTPGTQTKLDTQGTIRARDSAGGDHGVESFSAGGIGNVIAYERTPGNSGYRTLRLDGSTLNLNLNSPGNVGVGPVVTPQAKLHVGGTFIATGSAGFSTGTASATAPLLVGAHDAISLGRIRIGANNGSTARAWDIGPSPTLSPLYGFAITDASAGAERLVIKADGTGNVGVGISNPTNRLHVNGTIAAEGAITTAGTAGTFYDVTAGGDLRAGKKLIANSRTVADENGNVFGAVYQ